MGFLAKIGWQRLRPDCLVGLRRCATGAMRDD
jgi:hypothetical protein